MSRRPVFEAGGARWWVRPGVDLPWARRWVEAALQALEEAKNLKTGRRKALYALALAGDRPDHLLKVRRYERGARLSQRLRASRSRRELERACDIAERGIPTPLPLAAGELRHGGLLRSCFLLIPVLEGARDLRQLCTEDRASAAERRAWAQALGALCRSLHDAGLFQEDFAPNNFLLRPGTQPELWAIDFERARLRRRVRHSGRCFMLAKFERSFKRLPLTARFRFLIAYSQGSPGQARQWWGEIDQEACRLVRRDWDRLARTATREGRRFRPIQAQGGRGWVRRDSPLPEELGAWGGRSGERRVRRPEVVGRGDFWCWSTFHDLGRARAGRLWALAQLLYLRRGLGPRPVAFLYGPGGAHLWLEREPGSLSLDSLQHAARARGAVTVLVHQLLALGELPGELVRSAIALRPRPRGGYRAFLLDPSAFRPGRATDLRARRALARRRAAELGLGV